VIPRQDDIRFTKRSGAKGTRSELTRRVLWYNRPATKGNITLFHSYSIVLCIRGHPADFSAYTVYPCSQIGVQSNDATRDETYMQHETGGKRSSQTWGTQPVSRIASWASINPSARPLLRLLYNLFLSV
jgi:hypothetical protein